MITAFKSFWKNAFNFHGRATRSEYWFFMLDNMIIAFIIGFMMGFSAGMSETGEPGLIPTLIYGLYCFAIIIPSLSLCIRRLHDIGKSGWWYLILTVLNLFCGIGGIIMIVFACMDSAPDNQWGPNPKNINTYNQVPNQGPYNPY